MQIPRGARDLARLLHNHEQGKGGASRGLMEQTFTIAWRRALHCKESPMFRKSFWITAAAVTGLVANQNANAQYYGYGNSHGSVHQDLNHNEFHRQQYHSNQHQFPQSYFQHNQLHQDLNHDRYHDNLSHNSYHSYQPQYNHQPQYRYQPQYCNQSRYYGGSGSSGGVLRRELSRRFGF